MKKKELIRISFSGQREGTTERSGGVSERCPENGVAPGTAWEDVPEDWVCPWCDLGKDAFEEE